MPPLQRLIGAALVAGVLITAGAAAEEPRHLGDAVAVSVADAKARCVPALVRFTRFPGRVSSSSSVFLPGRCSRS